jgi:hypothetical protein
MPVFFSAMHYTRKSASVVLLGFFFRKTGLGVFYNAFLLFLWLNHMLIMKKHLLLFCLPVLLLYSCKKEPVDVPVLGKGATLTLLRVNYLDNSFLGGKTFNYPTYYSVNDSVPVHTFSRTDGTEGFLAQVYVPTNDTIFNGGTSLAGTGKLWYPVFEDRASFGDAGAITPAPAYAAIQQLMPKGQPLPPFSVSQVWGAVGGLAITKEYLKLPNARIGLFLYKPSQGPGNPADWSWVWVLYKDRQL